MKKYIAHIRQRYPGCGYTIGCGQAVIHIEAESWNEAVEKLHYKIVGIPGDDDRRGYWDELELRNAVLYEVSRTERMPLDEWYSEGRKAIIEQKCQEEEVKK